MPKTPKSVHSALNRRKPPSEPLFIHKHLILTPFNRMSARQKLLCGSFYGDAFAFICRPSFVALTLGGGSSIVARLLNQGSSEQYA
jgi:hypothetical protein